MTDTPGSALPHPHHPPGAVELVMASGRRRLVFVLGALDDETGRCLTPIAIADALRRNRMVLCELVDGGDVALINRDHVEAIRLRP